MAGEHWIQGAIEHPGYLTRWARDHGTLTAEGKIDVAATRAKAEELGDTHALRAANLLHTLRHLH